MDNIWSRLNPILLKLLRHRTGLERAQTANNFLRNSFVCGNLSFLAPHFGVLQWSLSAHDSCLASTPPPFVRPPNRCNAMGTILNTHSNKQWHKTHALYATSDYAMCTYTPLLNMQATSKSTTWNDWILLRTFPGVSSLYRLYGYQHWHFGLHKNIEYRVFQK